MVILRHCYIVVGGYLGWIMRRGLSGEVQTEVSSCIGLFFMLQDVLYLLRVSFERQLLLITAKLRMPELYCLQIRADLIKLASTATPLGVALLAIFFVINILIINSLRISAKLGLWIERAVACIVRIIHIGYFHIGSGELLRYHSVVDGVRQAAPARELYFLLRCEDSFFVAHHGLLKKHLLGPVQALHDFLLVLRPLWACGGGRLPHFDGNGWP